MKILTSLLAVFIIYFPVFAEDNIFSKSYIKSMIDKVNDYQYNNPWTEKDGDWIRGTYYTGVMACYQATGDIKLLNQSDEWGESLDWKLPVLRPGERGEPVTLLTAAQTFLESYMADKKDYKIKPTIAHLEDENIINPITKPLTWYHDYKGNRCADGLFVGPPALTMLYTVTKDEKYLQWMESWFWETYGNLFDLQENLFYRDNRFFPYCIEERKNDPEWKGNHQVTAAGNKVIWSRGNGWALASITRILKYLPKDHASYPRYLTVYKSMAESLKSRQLEEGYWSSNLADPNDFPGKETSGTSFFIYGLTYGINNGILDRAEYLPVVKKAWKFVCDAVSEEGKIQWGQIVGDRPVVVKKEDSHEFISGIFLLAASEMYKLEE